jgi:hypothetical protein
MLMVMPVFGSTVCLVEEVEEEGDAPEEEEAGGAETSVPCCFSSSFSS